MRRLPFVRHLPVGQLPYRYVTCRHPVEKTRWHALWLLARTDSPRTPAAVSDVVGLSAVAVRHVLHQKRPPDGGVWTGPTLTVLLPRVNAERTAAALAAFAAHADPGGTKILVVAVGRAGWHRARRLPVPPDIRLHFLPPYTPELQPVEPFGVLVRGAVANGTFDRLADLRRVIRRRCRRPAADRGTVEGAVGFRRAARWYATWSRTLFTARTNSSPPSSPPWGTS